MNILITGANSFVGKSLKKFSRQKNIDEIDLLLNKPEEIKFRGKDVVVHVAAIVHQTSKISEEKYFLINRDLCLAVAREAKKQGVKQFIFMSTVKVYGDNHPKNEILTEFSACEPTDAYGKSKHEAEIELKKLDDEHFTVSVIRTPLVYGIGVKANMLSMIKLVDKISILPFKHVQNRRSFTSVENLVELIDVLIEKKVSGVFMAKDKESLSTTELVKYIAQALNKRLYLFAFPQWILNAGKRIKPSIYDRLFDSFEMNNDYTRNALGYEPVISSKAAISKMVQYYIETKQ